METPKRSFSFYISSLILLLVVLASPATLKSCLGLMLANALKVSPKLGIINHRPNPKLRRGRQAIESSIVQQDETGLYFLYQLAL